MTEEEHLLTILAEECAEVAHRVSKALRFSLDEVEPGQKMSNAQRIRYELDDLIAIELMLVERGIIPHVGPSQHMELKQARVRDYLKHSRDVGALHD